MARPSLPSGRVVALLALSALALMTIDARGFAVIDRARATALAVSGPLRDGVSYLLSPASDGFHAAVHYEQLADENAQLRAEVAELQGQIDQLPDRESELAELSAAVEVDYLEEYTMLTARIVTDRRTGLERIIEIDLGSDDGIEPGFPVVTGGGLVGRTDLVNSNRSTIRLVTDPELFVGVRALASGAVGVVQGDGEGRPLNLDLAESGQDAVRSGTRFVTAGTNGSRFPLGIPVGRASDPVDEDGTIAPTELIPSADLATMIYLSVVILPPEPPTSDATGATEPAEDTTTTTANAGDSSP